MTSILVDTPPETLVVGGEEYEINSDFRFALSAILAFEDPELTLGEKNSVVLQNIFGESLERIPEDSIEEAIDQCRWFMDGGHPSEPGEQSSGSRVYALSHDEMLIFAAFQSTHGIDLSNSHLHWWRFLSLFMDLGQDTAFCQLVALRKRDQEGKLSKEEQIAVRAMGSLFRLPRMTDEFTSEEQAILDRVNRDYETAKAARKRGK